MITKFKGLPLFALILTLTFGGLALTGCKEGPTINCETKASFKKSLVEVLDYTKAKNLGNAKEIMFTLTYLKVNENKLLETLNHNLNDNVGKTEDKSLLEESQTLKKSICGMDAKELVDFSKGL